jgi:hypothetical protein
MKARESTPAEKTTERGFFNWGIIKRPPWVENVGVREEMK